MHVNVRTAIVCAQALVPGMRKAGYGRIVMNTSRVTKGKEARTLYSASKGALQSMARTWALELARVGITVNCVAPGPIATTAFWKNNPPDAPETKAIVTASLGQDGHARRCRQRGELLLRPQDGFRHRADAIRLRRRDCRVRVARDLLPEGCLVPGELDEERRSPAEAGPGRGCAHRQNRGTDMSREIERTAAPLRQQVVKLHARGHPELRIEARPAACRKRAVRNIRRLAHRDPRGAAPARIRASDPGPAQPGSYRHGAHGRGDQGDLRGARFAGGARRPALRAQRVAQAGPGHARPARPPRAGLPVRRRGIARAA